MAEEFALEQGFAQGTHIDGDEDFVGARRAAMNLARHQLLARAVLAEDEDAGVGGGHLGHGLKDFL